MESLFQRGDYSTMPLVEMGYDYRTKNQNKIPMNNTLTETMTFKQMDCYERKVFLTYVSEHILHSDEKFEELSALVDRWNLESPLKSVINDYESSPQSESHDL